MENGQILTPNYIANEFFTFCIARLLLTWSLLYFRVSGFCMYFLNVKNRLLWRKNDLKKKHDTKGMW